MDGGETSGDSGGVRLTVSQDDVQEFQINRSNYAAELGAATGASINIVTKSGSQQSAWHAVWFLPRRLRWTLAIHLRSVRRSRPTRPSPISTPLSVGDPIKDTLTRQQFGGAIGFPIQKDKTFLLLLSKVCGRTHRTPFPC